jgi:hypothetical protein
MPPYFPQLAPSFDHSLNFGSREADAADCSQPKASEGVLQNRHAPSSFPFFLSNPENQKGFGQQKHQQKPKPRRTFGAPTCPS